MTRVGLIGGKGYRVIHRQNCWDISPIADGVYSGSNRGCPEHSSPMFLGLILAVGRSPQYEVDDRSRSWSMFDFCNGPTSCGSSCCPQGWLPQVSSEVAGPNKLFYHKFEALAVIGLVAMVPMVIAS